ncbi:MAG: family 16 glycosylhydrolase [Planctomycetota bacterium]
MRLHALQALALACAALAASPAIGEPAALEAVVIELTSDMRTTTDEGQNWYEFTADIDATGRYRTEVVGVAAGAMDTTVWLEDYVENPDGRTYDVTGPIAIAGSGDAATVSRDGSPLARGSHRMRLHVGDARVTASEVRFELLREHQRTPLTLIQPVSDEGEWTLRWSDEFDGEGLPDPKNWTHDLGNWGWGNREPQYYTDGDLDNARQEAGNLIIEARPNDDGHAWTSARLTTRGKVTFLRGRFEIRAKVPAADGTWAAGWMLGDDYRDEISWPYCGEIDVLEAVGREIGDDDGNGLNHASCHTRAYYFKQGNHISNQIALKSMSTEFHTYACEWDADEVRMYVDGNHYYTYDKKESELAWPFDRPQNLILNLAMGGGMGGDIAADIGPQQFVVDYVRVYERP